MLSFVPPTLLLLLALAAVTPAADSSRPPLGHKDFYPSPDRPVGFRGDGNGCFPGATPVTAWREGTIGRRDGSFVLTDRQAHHVVWKTEMPSWANTQPIVVGDRVFTTAEPNRLVCVDARTGKILWTAAANPWELAGMDHDRAEQVQGMYDLWREVIPHFDRMWHAHTMTRQVPAEEFTSIANAFLEKVLPRVLQELARLDPEGKYDEPARVTATALVKYRDLLAAGQGKYQLAKHDPLKGRMTRLADALARRINERGGVRGSGKRRTARTPLGVPWGNLVGFCMSAPVSDGEHVYASFGQGQTACYDLNGKRRWGVHFTPSRQKDDLSGVQSPLLVGGVLVDMHGGEAVVRGLDARTGKLLWEAPTRGEGLQEGGGYFVGSHKVVRLGGDHSVDVVVTTLGNIIRATDGKVLGALPFPYRPSGGPSIVALGDLVWKGANGDNYRTPYIAYRLTLVGKDRVEARPVWRTSRSTTPGYQSVVVTPTALVMASRDHTVLDVRTGKGLFRSPGGDEEVGGFSNIVAGKVFFWAADGSRSWARRGKEVFGSFGTAELTAAGHLKLLSNANVLGGVNKPRLPAMEKFAPELYALPFYTGHSHGWPAHFLHTDTALFPSGNRLFIRSVSHLYCVGDPSTPYDWNPAARPARITATLTVK